MFKQMKKAKQKNELKYYLIALILKNAMVGVVIAFFFDCGRLFAERYFF